MARQKRKSDELYNIRRRYKREAAKAFKLASSAKTEEERAHLQSYGQIQLAKAQGLYLPKGRAAQKAAAKETYARARKADKSFNEVRKSMHNAQARKDFIFKQVINEASRGNATALDAYDAEGKMRAKGQQLVKMFYRKTRQYWDNPNVAANQRNEAIVAALGVSSLEDAFNLVLAQNIDDILRFERMREQLANGIDTTETGGFYDEDSGEPDDFGSPIESYI